MRSQYSLNKQLGPRELRVKTTFLAQITLRAELNRINDSMRPFGRSAVLVCTLLHNPLSRLSYLILENLKLTNDKQTAHLPASATHSPPTQSPKRTSPFSVAGVPPSHPQSPGQTTSLQKPPLRHPPHPPISNPNTPHYQTLSSLASPKTSKFFRTCVQFGHLRIFIQGLVT